jgi:hypothetical protein
MDPVIRQNAQPSPAVAESAPPCFSLTTSLPERGQQRSSTSRNQTTQRNIRLPHSPPAPSNVCSSTSSLRIAMGF